MSHEYILIHTIKYSCKGGGHPQNNPSDLHLYLINTL